MNIGAYYFLPERPAPVELLTNPPYATSTEHEPACGTGAFLVQASDAVEERTPKPPSLVGGDS